MTCILREVESAMHVLWCHQLPYDTQIWVGDSQWPQILQIVEAERFDLVSEWTETINELISDLVSWAERAMIYKSLVEVSSFLQTTKRDKLRYSNKLTKFLNKIILLFHLHPRNLQWLTFEYLNRIAMNHWLRPPSPHYYSVKLS